MAGVPAAGGMSASASSSAKSGDIGSTSTFMGGDFYFGGSGSGGGRGAFDLGALVSQYWPLFLLAGGIWYIRKKKR